MRKQRRNLVVILVIAILGVVVVTQVLGRDSARKNLDLSTYENRLSKGQVEEATLYDRDHVVKGALTNGTDYEVRFPEQYTDEITKEIRDADVAKFSVDSQKPNPWLSFVAGIMPFLLIIGLAIFFMSQMQGGGSRVMSFGKSRAKAVSKDSPKTTFADVAGLDEAVEELQEIKDFLADPTRVEAIRSTLAD